MSDGWFSRPVFFVASVERAIDFYCRKLGFVEDSRYEEDGTVLVGQVTREDCELLLNCQQPDKTGKGRMFISLDLEPLRLLRSELEGRGAPIRDGWWGYDTMIVEDPDGNELYFPYPNEEDDEEESQSDSAETG
jgi:catechol 2,3-dioxygenase-like lactoylglutathione lyase family enzyme